MDEKESFGRYLATLRKAKKFTVRSLAANLDQISPQYLSDVENGRRNPFKLEKINHVADILGLTEQEKTHLMELAGKFQNTVAPDIPAYVLAHEAVHVALRKAMAYDVSEQEWLDFVQRMEQKRTKN